MIEWLKAEIEKDKMGFKVLAGVILFWVALIGGCELIEPGEPECDAVCQQYVDDTTKPPFRGDD